MHPCLISLRVTNKSKNVTHRNTTVSVKTKQWFQICSFAYLEAKIINKSIPTPVNYSNSAVWLKKKLDVFSQINILLKL